MESEQSENVIRTVGELIFLLLRFPEDTVVMGTGEGVTRDVSGYIYEKEKNRPYLDVDTK